MEKTLQISGIVTGTEGPLSITIYHNEWDENDFGRWRTFAEEVTGDGQVRIGVQLILKDSTFPGPKLGRKLAAVFEGLEAGDGGQVFWIASDGMLASVAKTITLTIMRFLPGSPRFALVDSMDALIAKTLEFARVNSESGRPLAGGKMPDEAVIRSAVVELANQFGLVLPAGVK